MTFPTPFSGRKPEEEEDPMRRMTKKEIVGYTLGIGLVSSALAVAWSDYVYRKRMLRHNNSPNSLTVHKYQAQTAEWQATLSSEELQDVLERRKQRALNHAMQEGAIGAAQAGGTGGIAAILLKVAESQSKTFQAALQSPFVSFHTRPVNLLFYVSSMALVGFYIRGAEAASPKGSRFVVHDDHGKEAQR